MAAKKAAKKSSAKKKKANPKKGVAGDTTSAETTTLLMPPIKTVVDLANDRRDSKKRQQSIAGTFGKAMVEAVQNKHIDRKAHAMACSLREMDDERLHVTYFHLMKYLDDMGVVKRATAQSEMFENRGADEDEEETGGEGEAAGEGEADDGKVTSIGTAARKVAETAGGGFH